MGSVPLPTLQDLHWYMSALEESVIRTLDSLGIVGERVAGRTGVWVGGAKVCAMGVKISRWVSMHGLALNVRPPLRTLTVVPRHCQNRSG